MIRFIGWRWNAEHRESTVQVKRQIMRLQSAHLWECVLVQPGLQVFMSCGPHDEGALRLPGGRGVVIGSIFCGGKRCRALDEAAAQRVFAHDTDELFTRYWGNYVAVLSGPGGEVTLVRAPAATLPCLRRTLGRVEQFSSCSELSWRVAPAAVRINWRRVGQQLIGPASHPQTGLHGVRELLPGWRERLTAHGVLTEAQWFPPGNGHAAPFTTVPEAASALHSVITECTQAWAAGTSRVMVGLSGGLDSSIVLAALTAAPRVAEPVCVTHFAPGLESDERHYARLAARRARVRHLVRERATTIDLHRAQGGMRTAHMPGLRMPEIDRDEPALARELGATAIFRGHGGDELFMRNGALPAACDAWCTRARGAKRLALLLHAAVSEGVTVWQVMRSIARTRFTARHRNLLHEFLDEQADQCLLDRDFLTEILAAESLPVSHPGAARLPFGRWWQWSLATGPRPYAGPHAHPDDVPEINSLLSQPVIEAALRIPAWLQVQDKTERAVARAAFAQQLPVEILARRSKGNADGPARQVLRDHESFVRDLLLGGVLARERVIDVERIEATLAGSPAAAPAGTVALFELTGAEIWARKWLSAG